MPVHLFYYSNTCTTITLVGLLSKPNRYNQEIELGWCTGAKIEELEEKNFE